MKCKLCNSNTEIWYRKLFDDRHGYPGRYDIRKCTICGFSQTDPQMNKKQINKLYSSYYPRQNVDLSRINVNNYNTIDKKSIWRKGLLNSCEYWVKPKSTVLDVGSGLGYGLLRLRGALKCKAYGIDPDINAQKVAKKFKLNFSLGYIEDKPFPNIKFDFIIVNQVLEHIIDPINFLANCKSRLKKGGKIILSFPNTNCLGRLLFGANWLHWHVPYHLNHFNKKSIVYLSKKAGLKITLLKTITPNMWTNLQIRRLLSKTRMGQRDTFWDGLPIKTNKIVNNNLFKKSLRFLEENNYLNRIIDFLGLGESILVILSTS